MHYLSRSVNETKQIGEILGAQLKQGDSVLLTGEMGSGKTHFTKGLGKAFAIEDEITSPTFALVNEYFGKLNLFHFDLFRIDNFDDLYGIGFFDYVERNGIMVIEWSERIPFLYRELTHAGTVYTVNIIKTDDCTRKIIIEENSTN